MYKKKNASRYKYRIQLNFGNADRLREYRKKIILQTPRNTERLLKNSNRLALEI